MIGSVGDFTIEVAQQYRKLTPDVSTGERAAELVQHLYQGKINDCQTTSSRQSTTTTTAPRRSQHQDEDRAAHRFPRPEGDAERGCGASRRRPTFAKAPVYNRLVTAPATASAAARRGGGSQPEDPERQLRRGGRQKPAAATSRCCATSSTAPSTITCASPIRRAGLIEDFTLFNARYLGDAPRPAALDASILDIKRQDRAADTFGAFDRPDRHLQLDAFRTSFPDHPGRDRRLYRPEPGLLAQHPARVARRARRPARSTQDAKDIAQPVAVNRIQYDLFNAALTRARSIWRRCRPSSTSSTR